VSLKNGKTLLKTLPHLHQGIPAKKFLLIPQLSALEFLIKQVRRHAELFLKRSELGGELFHIALVLIYGILQQFADGLGQHAIFAAEVHQLSQDVELILHGCLVTHDLQPFSALGGCSVLSGRPLVGISAHGQSNSLHSLLLIGLGKLEIYPTPLFYLQPFLQHLNGSIMVAEFFVSPGEREEQA
jgi:hypothetical protein